jgi:hypothetical protein
MMEGSRSEPASEPLINGSGRPKNLRIGIRNTGGKIRAIRGAVSYLLFYFFLNSQKFKTNSQKRADLALVQTQAARGLT